jgi:APA family basic amino acid/polyamine antiporter
MKNHLNGNELKREIGLFSAAILVVANMIGTGIFTTSGFIMAELGSPVALLLCWIIGGIFALCGALCYGELGAAFPHAGGEYVYLREGFGKLTAFLSGWISLIVGFSAPIAAAAIAFAIYTSSFAPISANLKYTLTLFDTNILTISPVIILAIGATIILSLVHYHSLRIGSRVQNFLTIFKISIIVIFITAGFFLGQGSSSHFAGDFSFESLFQSKFTISLIFVSFAYSGWNAAAYIGSEIKNPAKNIPIALFTGTLFVLVLYLLLNALYIYALPASQMNGVLEIGTKSATSLFGGYIGKYFSGAIAIGILSALSAMIMTGPRVYYAMARDSVFFELFGRVDKKYKTPAFSIFLQATIAIVMILTSSFDKLLIYIGFTLAIFSLLTVLGLIILRLKNKAPLSAYQTFGYPLTPIIFIAGNLWIVCFSIYSRPITSLCGLITIGLGVFVYYCFSKKKLNMPNTGKTNKGGGTHEKE